MTKPTDPQAALREQVLAFLKGGHAHAEFDQAVADLTPELRGQKPPGQPHTPWRLLEHMRIAQEDILKFCTDAGYESPSWPDGYWPEGDGPPNAKAWDHAVERFHADRKRFIHWIRDPKTDLLAPIPHGEGQTPFREAMLIVDHTAYHVAQLILIRRLLGAWSD